MKTARHVVTNKFGAYVARFLRRVMSKKGKALIIVAAALFLALAGTAAYFLVYYRLVNAPTGSMANTIIPGDRVLCVMGAGEIKRGDIVITAWTAATVGPCRAS